MKSQSFMKEFGSYKDPSGYVFYHGDNVYRYVEQNEFLFLRDFLNSELYKELQKKRMVVNTKIINLEKNFVLRKNLPDTVKKVFQHEKIEFISYPYEWSISMCTDAALLTLEIQNKLLKHGFSLKDATPYNIQFLNSNPIFIDICSIEKVERTGVWKAYNQFCQFWLYPILLYRNGFRDFQQIYLKYLDGIPLEKAVSILGIWRPFFRFRLLLDYFLPALMSKFESLRQKSSELQLKERKNSEKIIAMNVNRLISVINNLGKNKFKGHWSDYSDTHSYYRKNEQKKLDFISNCLSREKSPSKIVLDMGCNVGKYSRLAESYGFQVVAIDSEMDCINQLYIDSRDNNLSILPLCIDLLNPSPALGWNNDERKSFLNRMESKFDFVLSLALVHHLLVTGRVPLGFIVDLQRRLTKKYLITEFVGPNDGMFQKLMHHRAESYDYYDIIYFKNIHSKYFEILSEVRIIDDKSEMERVLFLMMIKNS